MLHANGLLIPTTRDLLVIPLMLFIYIFADSFLAGGAGSLPEQLPNVNHCIVEMLLLIAIYSSSVIRRIPYPNIFNGDLISVVDHI